MTGKLIFICAVALVVRISMCFIGEHIDGAANSLNYTDIDYQVFSDGARLMFAGKSPYERVTYRYPPLVAFLLMPVEFFPVLGKVLFSLFDVLCVAEVYFLLSTSHCSCSIDTVRKLSISTSLSTQSPPCTCVKSYATTMAWVHALNPAFINICTRGSMDALPNWLILMCVRLIQQQQSQQVENTTNTRLLLAGALFGLVTHIRLFPVIYAPLLCLAILFNSPVTRAENNDDGGHTPQSLSHMSLTRMFQFIVVSFWTFVVFTSVSAYMYGHDYIQNAVLYHLTRVDHRHNFSMHFYDNYLKMSMSTSSTPQGQCATTTPSAALYNGSFPATNQAVNTILASVSSILFPSSVPSDATFLCSPHSNSMSVSMGSLVSKVLFFLPQLVIILLIAYKFMNRPLCQGLLLTTMAFVCFNKVITAQYFLWFACFAVVCAPYLLITTTKEEKSARGGLLFLCVCWCVSMGLWLACAYQLEFGGLNYFWNTWMASVIFYVVNCALIGVLARALLVLT